MKVVYLCSPYSYKSKFRFISFLVRLYREYKISKIAAALTETYKVALICPITTSHRLAKFMKNPGTSFEAWKDIDLAFVESSHEVWVVDMPGYLESIGVQAEILHAIKHKKTIRYINAKTSLIYIKYNRNNKSM